MSIKEYDFLDYSNDADIKKLINDEKILYCDFVSKISRFGLNQERIILLTDKNIYYLKSKSPTFTINYPQLSFLVFQNLLQDYRLSDFFSWKYHMTLV